MNSQPTPGALRDPADGRFVPCRQLPRRPAAVGRTAGQPRDLLLDRRPARDHRRAGPEGAAAADQGGSGATAGAGHRPATLHAVRAVAGAGAHPAVVGDGVPDRLRRGEPDDAVQGQVAARRRRPVQRRALHLPDPAGGGHPGLPGGRRSGGGGPATAPRAHPEPRAAVQRPIRADADRAGAVHPEGNCEDLRPGRTLGEDEQVLARRITRPARAGQLVGQEDQVRGHRHRARDPLRREGQARGVEPVVAAVGVRADRRSPTSRRSTRARATAT